jgi:hypothetical protein
VHVALVEQLVHCCRFVSSTIGAFAHETVAPPSLLAGTPVLLHAAEATIPSAQTKRERSHPFAMLRGP